MGKLSATSPKTVFPIYNPNPIESVLTNDDTFWMSQKGDLEVEFEVLFEDMVTINEIIVEFAYPKPGAF